MVNDYRKEGSLELLVSLFRYTQGVLDLRLLSGILEMRLLFETETARLAALNRTERDRELFLDLLKEEEAFERMSAQEIARVDYQFHHQLALAGGNIVYPLLMNSLKPFYIGILEKFYLNREVLPQIQGFHRRIVSAVLAQDPQKAAERMRKMLLFSQEELYKHLPEGSAPR